MPDPRLTREQDAELRRLLAQARHDEPLPEDVAQRLDRVVDGLRAETAAPTPAADLGIRRDRARTRRRQATQLLLAAAVVVVGGVGVGHLVSRSVDDNGSSADSASTVDRGASGSSGADAIPSGPRAGIASDGSAPAPSAATLSQEQFQARLPVPLSSLRLGRDVGRAASLAAQAGLAPGVGAIIRPVAGWTCSGGFTVTGDADLVLPAQYDGRPTLLVLSPTDLGHQRARVLECGSLTQLRRLVVSGS